jgi:Dolichyl-phosphate-mannose-protein mannosyltransferase
VTLETLSPPDRRTLLGIEPRVWLALAGLLVLVALTFKPVVENDGVGYYAYLHTVLVDHDLDFGDEYAALAGAGITYYPPLFQARSANGRLADFFPAGPALLAAPAYLVVLAVKPSGEPQYGPPFSWAFTLASLFYGLLALVLGYRLASSLAGRRSALVATAGVALATPFLYYLLYEPSYSHTFSAFSVSTFLYVWWRWRDRRSAAGWLVLGLLGGLMGLTRFQDGPLLLIALLDRPRRFWYLLPFAAGVLVGFAPQLAIDQYLFGGWLPNRPAGEQLDFFPGHYLQVLFSSQHGFFIWTPISLLAIAGFAFVRDRRLQAAFVLALLIELAISGSAPDWNGDFSFGQRRFVALTPFLVIGLAALVARIRERPALVLVGLLVAWNLLLMVNFTYLIGGSQDPGYLGLLTGQVKALRYLPHLVSQGAVGRMLLFWPVLKLNFQPLAGLMLLAGEAACLLGALAAGRLIREPSPPAAGGREAAATEVAITD